MHVSRRTLLAAGAAVAASAAGCLDDSTGDGNGEASPSATPTPTEREPPEDCPTTQELDVEWPDDLDAAAAESFVGAYENAYYRVVVVDYEPESMVDEYGLEAGVRDGPTVVDGGYEVALSGSGGVYRPTLRLRGTTADAPEDADLVPLAEVEDDTLRSLLETAAAEGEADQHVEPPGERVDQYIERVASLSDDFEPLDEPGDEDTAYFDVDGTTVELTVQADRFHGDYWWNARYYVDEQVVWRVDDAEGDPRDGELLECRTES